MSEVSFSFDDKPYNGKQGEPMAAALLRSGLLSITNSTYMAVLAVSLDWALKNPMYSFSWFQVQRNLCFRPRSLK